MRYERAIRIAAAVAVLATAFAASEAFAQAAPATDTAQAPQTAPQTTASTTAIAASSTDNAAGAAFSEPSCGVTTEDLSAVQAAAQNGLLAELAARRALITKIIGCAVSNAQALQDEANNISLAGIKGSSAGEAAAIKSQLSGKLGDTATYYNLELQKVPTAGIAGTKAIANEVLAWRTSNYEPLAENVSNFELWVSSQPLVTAASDRLSGIASLVAYFEQAGADNTLQADLSSAQALVQSAKDANRTAEDALYQSLAPAEVRADIQTTLQSLSAAYGQFFNVANDIQALLPASK